MGNNPSVRQFKTDMQDLVNRAKYNFHQVLLMQAEEVAGNMRNAIQHSITGNLKASIRTRDVSTADETKLSVLVLAGGHLTIKYEKSGAHDYAFDVEFGDKNHAPEPFFYSTYRLYIQHGLQQFQETLDQTIAENNTIRVLRDFNYNSNGETGVGPFNAIAVTSNTVISNAYKGAIVIQGNPINGNAPYKPPFGGY